MQAAGARRGSEAESLWHEGDRLAGALAALLVAEPDRPGGRHRHKPQGAAVGAAQGREVDHVGEVARRGSVVVGLRGAPRHGHPEHRDPQGTAGPRPPRGRKDDARTRRRRPRRGSGGCGTGSFRTPRTPSTSWPRHSGSPAPSSTPRSTPTKPSSYWTTTT